MRRNTLSKTAMGLFTAGCILLGYQAFPEVYNRYKQSKAKEVATQTIETVVQTIEDTIAGRKTSKEYGKNIVYLDFSKISEELIPKEKMKLPSDLKEYLNDKYKKPSIKDKQRFEKEFWEEALKLGYTPGKFKNASVKEAIKAAVDITASRFTFEYVDDEKNWFAQKYGKFLNTDDYFHYGLGDCDKYRDVTIAAFEIIKKINPKLENVYLSNESLGGSMKRHAWVSIIIPQKNHLILSHIDPTFYDNGDELEASKDECDAHILVYNDAFKPYFYRELKESRLACELFKESFYKTEDASVIEQMLDDMCYTASQIYPKKQAVENVEWARKEYEARGFTEHLNNILYYSYTTYSEFGDKKKAEEYKQRLFKECPDSYWTRFVKEKKD